MRIILLRLIPSVAVFLSGLAFLIYGTRYHTLSVTEEQEIEITIAPPGIPPFGGDPTGPPPMMGPPPSANKAKEQVTITKQESETTLVKEVSFGGVTLAALGQLRRTYSGEPPLLCPT